MDVAREPGTGAESAAGVSPGSPEQAALLGSHPGAAGVALRFALAVRRLSARIDDEALAVAANHLGVPTDALSRVLRFIADAVDTEASPGALTVCRGVNCSLNGAAATRAALDALLAAAGSTREITEVFCLNHCDRGPSLRLDARVLCSGTNDVETDARTWRSGAGPVAFDDRSRPVLD